MDPAKSTALRKADRSNTHSSDTPGVVAEIVGGRAYLGCMRVLHTSDWHIGRTFHGQDLLADQESVLRGIADLVTERGIDVVLVAGDLYDRAVPSAEAVAVCGRALAAIGKAGARIIVTAGNHDSAARVGVFAQFAEAGGLHLRTEIGSLDTPILLPDEHGEVAFYGIPYLEPDIARRVFEIEERTHTAVLAEAMRRVRADLATRQGTRSVVLAHAFVTGGAASDSERKLVQGGIEQVPGSVFDGVDYVALGHLHGPQRLAEHLQYSGSPLAYSFSEENHRKSVLIAEFDASGLVGVERQPLPVPRPLATVTGELDELLADPELDGLREHYLSATLTDRVRPVDGMRKLRERFPYAVRLEWAPAQDERQRAGDYTKAVTGRDDLELADSFVAHCRGAELTGAERELVGRAFTSVGAGEREV